MRSAQVATADNWLDELQAFDWDTREVPKEIAELWASAENKTDDDGPMRFAAVLETFDQLASGELASGADGLKRKLLAAAYPKLSSDDIKFLELFFTFGTTFRRDIAPLESVRLMPMPLAVLSEVHPKCWVEGDNDAHLVAFNLARTCSDFRHQIGLLGVDRDAKRRRVASEGPAPAPPVPAPPASPPSSPPSAPPASDWQEISSPSRGGPYPPPGRRTSKEGLEGTSTLTVFED